MSDINQDVSDFLSKISDKHSILKFLYNINNQEFDYEKDSVFYSGPFWDFDEIKAIFNSVLNGKWISSGESVAKFEKLFSKKFNLGSSVMVNSGSSANLVMIASLKKFFSWMDNDEIIISTVGFPTTLSPVIQNNLKPVFVDINLDDLNFNLEQVEDKINNKTRGIFISPVLGNPPNFDRLVELSKTYNVELILDNCDSLGSRWKGNFLTEYTVSSSCSFYPAHHISTGEGGMVSSKHEQISVLARSFAWWGRDCYCVGAANLLPNGTCKKRFQKWVDDLDVVIDHKYVFSNIGYNLKPLDLQGSIGIEQLKKFNDIHLKRRKNKNLIENMFEKYVDDIFIVKEDNNAETSWFGVPIVCKKKKLKFNLVKHLEKNRIQTRNYFAGNILLHPAYSHLDDKSKYPIANQVLEKVFFVGCSPTYNDSMLNYYDYVLSKFNNN